ncbi:FH protein interacting protein FIP2, partial [Tanacetum coccineum]
QGDYYKYLAEFKSGNDKKEAGLALNSRERCGGVMGKYAGGELKPPSVEVRHGRVFMQRVNGLAVAMKDLSYVDFSFACLKNAFFSRANLHCAKFRDVDAEYTIFQNATLRDMNTNAELDFVKLILAKSPVLNKLKMLVDEDEELLISKILSSSLHASPMIKILFERHADDDI